MLLNLFKSAKYTKWKTYNNVIHYPKYGLTPMPEAKYITAAFTKLNVNGYIKQYQDSANITSTTVKPDVFFYRYDFAIKRMIAIIYMQKYAKIKVSGTSCPESAVEEMIDTKEQNTRDMIDRALADLSDKVAKLKTPKSKLNNIHKFVDSFKGFVEVSPENFTYLVTETEKLKKKVGAL